MKYRLLAWVLCCAVSAIAQPQSSNIAAAADCDPTYRSWPQVVYYLEEMQSLYHYERLLYESREGITWVKFNADLSSKPPKIYYQNSTVYLFHSGFLATNVEPFKSLACDGGRAEHCATVDKKITDGDPPGWVTGMLTFKPCLNGGYLAFSLSLPRNPTVGQILAVHSVLRATVGFLPETVMYGTGQALDTADSNRLREAGIIVRGIDAAFQGR